MEKQFTKKKIATYTKFTNELLEEMKVGTESYDFERGLMTVQLSNFIFTSMLGQKTIIKVFRRPTFLEWLLRKERTVYIDVVAEEILKNLPNKDIIYEIKEDEL